MDVLTIKTTIHGRVLHEPRSKDRLLLGFHGYAETAEKHLQELQKIPGIDGWSVAAVQGLRTFYTGRTGDIVANWMTSQDREQAIVDNVAYVSNVLGYLPTPKTLVFLGFSQGVAMAFRAAAHIRCSGVIALGGDLPPDVRDGSKNLPPVMLARGTRDDWYTAEKMRADLDYLQLVTDVSRLEFDGGHEFSEEFRVAAGEFLRAASLQ